MKVTTEQAIQLMKREKVVSYCNIQLVMPFEPEGLEIHWFRDNRVVLFTVLFPSYSQSRLPPIQLILRGKPELLQLFTDHNTVISCRGS